MNLICKTNERDEREYYHDGGGKCARGWYVYLPPPGQSSGPGRVVCRTHGSFIASRSGIYDVMGPFADAISAQRAADDDARKCGGQP